MSKKFFILFLLFLSSPLVHASEIDLNNLDAILEQTSSENSNVTRLQDELFLDIVQIELLEVFIFSMTKVIHKLGHTITAEALFGTDDSTQIHIGIRNWEGIKKLFSHGNMHIYETECWHRNFVMHKHRKDTNSIHPDLKLGIVKAAGGLSSAILAYSLLVAIAAYSSYCDGRNLYEIMFKSFINGTSPFEHILSAKNLTYRSKKILLNSVFVVCLALIYNIFIACTPYRSNDGSEIWEKCMNVTGTPLKIANIVSTLGAWSCWIFLIKKYCQARKELSPEDSKIAPVEAIISTILSYSQLIPKF